jgi:hypothetical protein
MPITFFDGVNDVATFSNGGEVFAYIATEYPPSVFELNLNTGDVNALRVRRALGKSSHLWAFDKKFTLHPLPLVSDRGGPLLLLHDAEVSSTSL